jgi:hypothetical protein
VPSSFGSTGRHLGRLARGGTAWVRLQAVYTSVRARPLPAQFLTVTAMTANLGSKSFDGSNSGLASSSTLAATRHLPPLHKILESFTKKRASSSTRQKEQKATMAEGMSLSEAVQKLWDLDSNRCEPHQDYELNVQEGKKPYVSSCAIITFLSRKALALELLLLRKFVEIDARARGPAPTHPGSAAALFAGTGRRTRRRSRCSRRSTRGCGRSRRTPPSAASSTTTAPRRARRSA